MLVDSHCHLDLIDPELGSIDQLLDDAAERGVDYFLVVSVDLNNVDRVREIADQRANVFASAGVHPNEVAERPVEYPQLAERVQHPSVIAVGETGLDYFRSENQALQQQQFALHVGVARECGKPLIIHCRDAAADTLELLRREKADQVGGIMHCFVEDLETAKQAIDLGFMVSFSGIVTFKSATQLQQVARKLPLDALLVETDSPWLAPVPWRGKTNQPAYVRDVAEYVAGLREMTVEELAAATTANFFRLFPRVAPETLNAR